MSPSCELRVKLSVAYSLMAPLFNFMPSNKPNIEKYAEFLLVLHGMVRGSVPVMQQAVNALKQSKSIPDHLKIIEYLEKHIMEEKNHDKWLEEDLRAIGFSHRLFNYIPSIDCACLVGMQYYWIEHVNPVIIIGYIAAMEGNPPSISYVNKIREYFDLPCSSIRTLEEHAAVDIMHNKALDSLIDDIDLTNELKSMISVNAIQTVKYANNAFVNALLMSTTCQAV